MTDRTHDTSRIEAFSDGVFAFSATLLVVSLEVPTSFPELVANLYGFVPFALTFGALVLIWGMHRAFFARFGDVGDGGLVALNAALLFVVLFFVQQAVEEVIRPRCTRPSTCRAAQKPRRIHRFACVSARPDTHSVTHIAGEALLRQPATR